MIGPLVTYDVKIDLTLFHFERPKKEEMVLMNKKRIIITTMIQL